MIFLSPAVKRSDQYFNVLGPERDVNLFVFLNSMSPNEFNFFAPVSIWNKQQIHVKGEI